MVTPRGIRPPNITSWMPSVGILDKSLVCAITIVCCILHNIAVDMYEPVPDFEEEEAFQDVDFAGVGTGQLVRNHLANTFF